MALGDLLAGLEAEAAAETARLQAETREEADRIVEAARAEARALQEQAARAGEAELRRETEQRRALARLAAAAAVRGAREEAFREFLAAVRARLGGLRERPGYSSVLRALIRESRAALPSATTLRVDPLDETLAKDLLSQLDLELQVVAALETAGGVELSSDDGRTVRNTIEERLANAEPALRLLFGESQREEAS
jgi:vacuolar-type H+-ATPase subunit E/Vma4